MPIVGFRGHVLPATCKLSLPVQPAFTWKMRDFDLEATFRIRIEAGSIVIDCELNRSFDQAHLLPLLVRSYDIARAAVDLAAFATGSGLTAILEKFVDCDGSEVPIVVSEHPTLAALATAVKLDGADFEKILRGVLSEPRLMVPLRDLIEAVVAPQRARANCRRAMRSLIRLFIGSSRSAEAAGLAVQESLQISTSYLQKITQMSAGAAPGESVPEVTRHAWIVMNRVLECLKRGGRPLPLSEFPLLT